MWQREFALAILCLGYAITVSGASVLGPAFVALSTAFDRNFSQIANLTAFWEIAIAIAGALLIPFARIWGKRHQFLLGLLLVTAGYVGAAKSTDYKSFLGSRIIQGTGTACFEALIGVSIGDLYHVHVSISQNSSSGYLGS